MTYIRGRELWGAVPATSIAHQKPSNVHTLVVHHTAGKAPVTLGAVKRELRSIQRQHMQANGWSDIGYNLLIDRWGRIWEGRGLWRIGAHTKNCNTNTIGVSFMGNYENLKLNKRQLEAYEIVKMKMRQHGIKIEMVRGHRDMPNQSTACPGKNIMKQLKL